MLIEKFLKQVELRSDKVAIKSSRCTLTYGFLQNCAARLSSRLMEQNPPRPFLAALLLDHDERMVIAMLGVLQAGGIYIPLDPTYPEARLSYMLADSAADILVTCSDNLSLAGELAKAGAPRHIININELATSRSAGSIEIEENPGQPAYILYTSGSSGKPKGVVQTRENILYYMDTWQQRFSLKETDRVVLFASYCHDGSIPDIYGALLNGAALYPFDVKRDTHIAAPAAWMIKEKITIWHSVPTLYRYIVSTLSGAESWPPLRLIILGGEPVREHDLQVYKTHFPGAQFANIYGQTESTVSSIWLVSADVDPRQVFIGESGASTEILIVEEDGDEKDELESGEIVLAGPYLSPGYLNDPAATHRAYSQDEELGRLYWSGDLGRSRGKGSIEILGRKDFQVKIHGFRVELGEIETLLMTHPRIHEAAAAVVEPGGAEDGYLCAYFSGSGDFLAAELRQYLAEKLPPHMIPPAFVKVESMPLTPTGKIDRKALLSAGTVVGTGVEYAAPGSDMEKALAGLWAEALGVDRVGIHDNFFDLGGNSMKVIRLHNKLEERLKITVPAVSIYRYMTVSAFARFLSEQEEVNRDFEKKIDRTDELHRGRERLRRKMASIGAGSD